MGFFPTAEDMQYLPVGVNSYVPEGSRQGRRPYKHFTFSIHFTDITH